jgi:hypothetical protein
MFCVIAYMTWRLLLRVLGCTEDEDFMRRMESVVRRREESLMEFSFCSVFTRV